MPLRTRHRTPAPIALSRFTNLVYPVHNGEKAGKIVVRFFADKDGRVTDAIPSVKGTTLTDKDMSGRFGHTFSEISI
jgi:hypothetical protein